MVFVNIGVKDFCEIDWSGWSSEGLNIKCLVMLMRLFD